MILGTFTLIFLISFLGSSYFLIVRSISLLRLLSFDFDVGSCLAIYFLSILVA